MINRPITRRKAVLGAAGMAATSLFALRPSWGADKSVTVGINLSLTGADAESAKRIENAGAGAVLGYSFVVTYLIGLVLQKTVGFRVDDDHEVTGVDRVHHGESGYEIGAEESEDVMARVAEPAEVATPKAATAPGRVLPAGGDVATA